MKWDWRGDLREMSQMSAGAQLTGVFAIIMLAAFAVAVGAALAGGM